MASDDSESNELEPILSSLTELKSKEDMFKFFQTKSPSLIKSVVNYFLNQSPSQSTELLQKLINSTSSTSKSSTSSSFPLIHYGVSLEIIIAGLLMVFKPKLFLAIFHLDDIEEAKYDYLRTTGFLCIVLGIHYYFEAKHRVTPLIQIAAYVRVIAAFCFAYFIHKGWVQKPVMAFGMFKCRLCALLFFFVCQRYC